MTTGSSGIMDKVKGGIISTVKGSGDVATTAMDTATKVTQAAIQDAVKIGGDLGHVATDAVTGAIHAARELGVSAEEAAAAAAHGALMAADKVGGAALVTVRNALTSTIDGVKVVLKEPFRNLGQK